VFIRQLPNFGGADVALYTEIAAMIGDVPALELAKRAIRSAIDSNHKRDGVSYLLDAKLRTARIRPKGVAQE